MNKKFGDKIRASYDKIADTSCKAEGTDLKIIDEYTIESTMFGERFYHSGNPAPFNSRLVILADFTILEYKIDQPGNQVILARKN